MRSLFLFLLAVLPLSVFGQVTYDAATNTYTVTSRVGDGIVFDGQRQRPVVGPGAKIIILPRAIPYEWIGLSNLVGTTNNPIRITNGRTGVVRIKNDSFVIFGNSRNVVVRGDFDGTVPPVITARDTVRYGFIVDHSSLYLPAIRNARTSGREPRPGLTRAGIGVTDASQNVSFSQFGLYNITGWGFWMNNISANYGRVVFTHSKITGAFLEGVYLGNTNPSATASLDSARFEDLIIENTWNNALQVSRAVTNAPVVIRRCAFKNISVNQDEPGQTGGVSFGQGAIILVENNTFQNVNGNWATVLCRAGIIRNNLVTASDGVYWNNKSGETTGRLTVSNNTLITVPAIPFPGFGANSFNAASSFQADISAPGQAVFTGNIVINSSPGGRMVSQGPTMSQSNNYYATRITPEAGFSLPSGAITLPANAIGKPSFSGDFRIKASHSNATRGLNFFLLRWPLLTNALDTEPPTVPIGLTGVPGNNNMLLRWSASTDNVRVTKYLAYIAGELVDSVDSPVLTKNIIGLLPATSYPFSVRAKDAAGNISPPISKDFTVHSIGPTVPGPLVAGTIEQTSVNLTISSPSSPTNGVALQGYVVFRDNIAILNVNAQTLTFAATGLTPNTSYAFTVRARDINGNLSISSSPLVVQTKP